ncbi:MAG: DUF4344 domain-containing metallopeptidase [Hyphomicrobium sp.]
MQALQLGVAACLPRLRSWRSCTIALALSALAGGTLWAGPLPDSPDCEARLEAAVLAISSHPRVKDVSPDKLRAMTEFVLGNTLFALMHEMGHGLIHDLGLPVLGHEEDAADAFATVMMLSMQSAVTHRVLVNAAKGWMISDRRSRDGGEAAVFYDAHGLDLQRAYNIICLMVGSDPDQFDDLAREANLPEERRQTCQGDYSNASWSWNKALEPYLRAPELEPMKYPIVFDKPEGSLDIFKQAFQASDIMGYVAAFAGRFVWRHGFGIEVRMCGEPGARWSIPERKMVFCYELADDFVQLYKLHGEDPLAELSPPLTPTSRSGEAMGYR